MSRFIEISPIPSGTDIQTVKENFSAYTINRFAIVGRKAFLEFEDPNDIETLDFTFADNKVSGLNDAEINILDESFIWPQQGQKVGSVDIQKTQKKQQAQFILDEPKKQETQNKHEQPKYQKQEIKIGQPTFIVVQNCGARELQNLSEEQIKFNIFGKFKVGRVYKWGQEVYVEFEDPNQIQTIQNQYPSLTVPKLGGKSAIDSVDDNFSPEIVQKTIAEHKRAQQMKKLQQQKNKKQQIERKAKQMQELMKKKQEQQEEQKKRQLQEKLRQQKALRQQKEEELERIQKQTAKIDDETKKTWTLKPDYDRPNRDNSSQPIKLSHYWIILTFAWTIYAVFF